MKNGTNGIDHEEEQEENFGHLEQQENENNVQHELPENRVERLAVLMKSLPMEDMIHIKDNRIPAFLRIDKDVKA